MFGRVAGVHGNRHALASLSAYSQRRRRRGGRCGEMIVGPGCRFMPVKKKDDFLH